MQHEVGPVSNLDFHTGRVNILSLRPLVHFVVKVTLDVGTEVEVGVLVDQAQHSGCSGRIVNHFRSLFAEHFGVAQAVLLLQTSSNRLEYKCG